MLIDLTQGKWRRNINGLPLARVPTGHRICNPGMCPDQELSPHPFSLWDDTATNWDTLARARISSLFTYFFPGNYNAQRGIHWLEHLYCSSFFNYFPSFYFPSNNIKLSSCSFPKCFHFGNHILPYFFIAFYSTFWIFLILLVDTQRFFKSSLLISNSPWGQLISFGTRYFVYPVSVSSLWKDFFKYLIILNCPFRFKRY